MNAFVTTRWSQVVIADGDDQTARAALAWLCERYWEPLRAHVRRRGVDADAADDLTQDFFLAILGGGVIARADPARGRFRTFLLACLDHHLAHAHGRAGAQKRGGGVVNDRDADPPAPAADPSAGFDRAWAETLLATVHDRLRREAGAGERVARLLPFLTGNGDAAAYAAAGQDLGLGEGAVKVAVHRLRGRFRELLRAEVAETLAEPTPGAIDAEIADLLAALRENL